MSQSNSITAIAVLLLAALAARGAVVGLQFAQLRQDPDDYRRLAENLAAHGVLGHGQRPSAYRPPLYPLLLRQLAPDGRVSEGRVAALHLILGIATVLVTWGLALRLGLGRWSLVPALLVAVDPILLNQTTLVMTETLATLLATVVLFILASSKFSTGAAAAGGLAIGLAALTRPVFLPWAVLLSGVLAWTPAGSPPLRRIGWATIWVAAVAATMLPWMLRNRRAVGRLSPTTTHGGYTLLLGNNPKFYEHLRTAPWGAVWDSAELDRQRVDWLIEHDSDEKQADADSYLRAREAIGNEPGMFLYACGVRIGRLWRFMPHRTYETESRARAAARWAIGLWYLTISALAVWGALGLGRAAWQRPWIAGWLLLLTLTAVHTFYWSNMRMRAPAVPLISILAVLGMRRTLR